MLSNSTRPIATSRDPRATWRMCHIDTRSSVHRRASSSIVHAQQLRHASRTPPWADPSTWCEHWAPGVVKSRLLFLGRHNGLTNRKQGLTTPRQQGSRQHRQSFFDQDVIGHGHHGFTVTNLETTNWHPVFIAHFTAPKAVASSGLMPPVIKKNLASQRMISNLAPKVQRVELQARAIICSNVGAIEKTESRRVGANDPFECDWCRRPHTTGLTQSIGD